MTDEQKKYVDPDTDAVETEEDEVEDIDIDDEDDEDTEDDGSVEVPDTN